MELGNQTLVTEFILIGFSWNFQVCIFLFIFFFIIYIMTMLGNGFLIFTVIVSPQLHTPMYYFLCNLSFLDLCYSSNALPRFLYDVLSKSRRISVIMCLTQMSIGLILAGIECTLLAVMAYDRYIAICFPLYYTTIMSWRVCRNITASMWLGSIFFSSFPTIFQPPVFCKENQVNHFYCEALILMELACGDTSIYKLSAVITGVFTLLVPTVFIVGSYICIIISILKIHSSQGRCKAFSTCASHLTLVVLFFGTCMTMYMGQVKIFSSHMKYISLIYIVGTPLLNPVIYSLRNNEVKGAFAKILTRCLLY
ncbi:olfactory receptor 5V1-like [Dendrobates tinctorius]|uniref:olfactory receptor 5V1-like n=1 Tax=Dendrobates tinctorius TaxID=92724 RepID=UPI003CCA5E43